MSSRAERVVAGFERRLRAAAKHEAALVKAFKAFARHLPHCNWGGWMGDTLDKCDCGLSAAVRACPPLRKEFKMKAHKS